MEMKDTLPKKIKLLGEDYKLKITDYFKFRCDDCDDELHGKIDYTEKEIFISELSKYDVDEILLHELGHYFANYYSLGDNEMFAEAFAKYVKLIVEQIYE